MAKTIEVWEIKKVANTNYTPSEWEPFAVTMGAGHEQGQPVYYIWLKRKVEITV